MDETPNHHHQQSLHFEQPQQQQGAGSIAAGSNQQQQQQHPHPHQQQQAHPHGREDCWSEGATFTLIQAWGDRYLHLNRGNLKQKHWRDVAEAVNLRHNSNGSKPKTDVQCKNRLDTLKKKYKLEKARLAAAAVASSSQQQPNGNGALAAPGTSKWVFFSKLDELIGPSKKGKSKQGGDAHNNAASFLKQKKQVQVSHQDLHNNNNDTSSDEEDDEDDGDSSEMVMTDSSPFIGNPNGGGVFLLDPASNNNNNSNSNMKKKKKKKRKYEDEGGPFKDLARAIIKFGEVYERIETAKQQALVELEKQRMEFTRDMELQRMQLFVQTQVELAKMKQAKHGNTEHYL